MIANHTLVGPAAWSRVGDEVSEAWNLKSSDLGLFLQSDPVLSRHSGG